MTPRLRAAVLLALPLLAAGCEKAMGPPREIPTLEVPSAETEEAERALRQAERLIRGGVENSAGPLLRRVIELNPRHARAHLLLGSVLAEAGKLTQAVEVLRRAVELNPKRMLSHALLAESLHSLGQLEQADAAYLAWIEQDGSRADAHYGLGRVRYLRGDYRGSVEALRRAERLEQGRADVRSELGLAMLAMGKTAQAERKQRDALEREPGNAVAWFRLGDAISAQGAERRPEAIAAMRRAVQLQPKLIHAHLYLYRLLRQAAEAGDDTLEDEAERRWNTVLRLHRAKQLPRHGVGPPLETGWTANAREEELRVAIDDVPGDASARMRLALWLHVNGYLDEAVSEYEALVHLEPRNALAHGGMGAAWLAQGRADRAERALRRALDLDASLEFAGRNLFWCLLALDRPAAASAQAGVFLAQFPEDVRARKVQGLARMRSGELTEGLQQIADAGWLE